MADVAEEDQVIAAFSSLLVWGADSPRVATILKQRKNERTQHGLNHISESENHSVITQNK